MSNKIEIDTKLAWLLGSIEESIIIESYAKKEKIELLKYLENEMNEYHFHNTFYTFFAGIEDIDKYLETHINTKIRIYLESLLNKGWIFKMRTDPPEFYYYFVFSRVAREYFDLQNLHDQCREKYILGKKLDQNPDV